MRKINYICKLKLFLMYTLEQLSDLVGGAVAQLQFPKEPSNLYAPLSYMLSIGGKRLRPLMCLAAYTLFAEREEEIDEKILAPAMALEVFHSFTLIHDDIMDKADIRRGVPTVYKKWDSNIAILSGDAMSIEAYKLIAKAPAERLPAVLELFSRTASQVCEGQQYDMDFEEMERISMEEYIKMIGLKTAVLLACSAKIGAIIGGADERNANLIYDFGYKLGLAFQIQDDYLDTFGNSATFGKNIGGDITNNKKTWLLIESLNRLRKRGFEEDLKEMYSLLGLGAGFAQEKISGISALYERSGAREEAERVITHYYKEAMKAIEEIDIPDERKGPMMLLAEKMVKRNK